MMRLPRLLSGLGLVLILVLATSVSSSRANNERSPLRGTWSFSQFNPSTTLLTPPNPLPITAVGTLVMDDTNHFTGHGVFNTPVEGLQTIELDLNGTCAVRNGNISNGLDCLFNFPSFNLFDVGRFCVAMANAQGQCFDEFRCVDTNEPGGTVLLVEYKRQQLGTCK
jgi:hypothetical protein